MAQSRAKSCASQISEMDHDFGKQLQKARSERGLSIEQAQDDLRTLLESQGAGVLLAPNSRRRCLKARLRRDTLDFLKFARPKKGQSLD